MGAFCGEFAHCCVAVEPAPAWTDLQAIQEIIDSLIGHVEWMNGIMQIVKQNIPIRQPQHKQMTPSRDSTIQIIQQLQNLLLKFGRLGHPIKRFRADIIANQFHKHEQRVIIFLRTFKSFYVAPCVAGISTVDCDVLVVVVVAEVPFSEVFVDGVSGVAFGDCVAGVAGFVGDVELVGDAGQEVVVGAFCDHAGVEEFFRN